MLFRASTRPAFRAVAMGVFGVALTAWVVAFGVPSDTVQIFIWLWFATIAWNVGEQPRYHLGFLRDWWLPMALLVFYFYSRGVADELFAMPVHYMMPIEVDRAMFGGELPSAWLRSEEHTSELQSLMRISYAVFCLKKKKKENIPT